MKSKLVTFARNPFRVRSFRRHTTALLVGLAVMAGTTFVLHAQLTNIQKSVLLSWPEPTEEQIVVAADSLAGPWTPWHEPCFKHDGKVSMATPTTAAQQFFKLVPGTQFIDDFDPAKPPYSTKGEWVPGFYEPSDASRWEVMNTNGTLRVHTLAPPTDPGQGRIPIRPPGPEVDVKDFWVAVDILNLDATHWASGLGIGARVGGDPDQWPGANNGYIAGLHPNGYGTNKGVITLWTGGSSILGERFTFQPGTPYRLIFSAVGTRLKVELLHLEQQWEPAVSPLVVTNSAFSHGLVGFFIQSGGPAMYDVTLDNFFVTGTTP